MITKVVRFARWAVAALCLLGWDVALAQARTKATLLLDHSMASPGSRVMAAVRLVMPDHWHTYWINPSEGGLGGQATTIEWELPQGITAQAIQWPLPRRLKEEAGSVFAYEGEVALLVPIDVSGNASVGEYTLRAKVAWLECDKSCVPGRATVEARLTIGSTASASPTAPEFPAWLARIPKAQPFPVALAWSASKQANDAKKRSYSIQFQPASAGVAGRWDFYPEPIEGLSFEGGPDASPDATGRVMITGEAEWEQEPWPGSLAGLVVHVAERGGDASRTAFRVVAQATTNASSATAVGSGEAAAGTPVDRPFLIVLGMALVGGLILNIMPCVLPVIALKILGFVRQAQESPGRVRMLGLMYGAGVISSFGLLGGAMVALSMAKQAVHQGILFQSSIFLVLMTVLVVVIALNLFGVFEVTLGTGGLGKAGDLAAKEGAGGAFFNGVLATVLATPCSAPYLGVSIGYALRPGQSPWVTLAMYLTAGLGLALPYVVLCFQPRWLKLLPKPGNWMILFKKFMGFPMLATAVWLFMLTANHYDKDRILWLGWAIIVVVLACWIYGQFIQPALRAPKLAWVAFLGLLALAYLWMLEREVDWRHPADPATPSGTGTALRPSGRHKLPWQPWSPEAVEKARASGKPILVDFTADYCTTCNSNLRLAIEVPAVIQRIQETGTLVFMADFSRNDPRIAAVLQAYQRPGVPLVLVYPAHPTSPPKALPELLRESIVLDAINWAVGKP
ncbi:MAG: protein-disulfide reductase DsbD domain-containing protein [Verrucomicrobiota bacterium]|jgi:thiol:disulfide interchange protein DsbD